MLIFTLVVCNLFTAKTLVFVGSTCQRAAPKHDVHVHETHAKTSIIIILYEDWLYFLFFFMCSYGVHICIHSSSLTRLLFTQTDNAFYVSFYVQCEITNSS
jgi:hypothetical protein